MTKRNAATTMYIATCVGACERLLPQAFIDKSERDRWADAHTEVTGHRVARHQESGQFKYGGESAPRRTRGRKAPDSPAE